VKAGSLVIPKDKGWKKYRKSMGIVIDRMVYHSGIETAIVHWFCEGSIQNEWAINQLEVISESR